MKSRLLFLLNVLFVSSLFAGVKTSVADGDWFNPNSWNPVGVPFMEDTVIIDHHVYVSMNEDVGINWLIINANDSLTTDSLFSLHGNLKNDGLINAFILAVGDGSTTINNGEIHGDVYATGNTTYDNQGLITSDSLFTSEVPFDNYGIIDNTSTSTSGTFNNRNVMLITANFVQSGLFTNFSGAGMNVGALFTISGDFTNQINANIVAGNFITSNLMTNNGDVSCDNWTNGGGTVTGVTGKFCVAQCFINNATINGTVDICDATPSFICDLNLGTIAGTVTFCAVSPCNTSVGIKDNLASEELKLYPNPFNGFFNIEASSKIDQVAVYDATGRLVETKLNVTEGIVQIPLSVEPGLYLVRVLFENGNVSIHRLLKN